MALPQHRIHIFGASGSGTSSLGRALADKLSIAFFDSDDYYWEKTEIPFTLKVEPEVRVQRLLADMNTVESWVLSGSIVSWSAAFIPLFTAAVFVTLEPDIRLGRLRVRERERHGSRIDKGGDMYEIHEAFISWAALYDTTANLKIRSLAMHEAWIHKLSCPCIRVESTQPVDILVDNVVRRLANVTNSQ